MINTFQKNCPICAEAMVYSSRRQLKQSLNNNSRCEKCRKEKISQTHKGKLLSEEHKKKIKLTLLSQSEASKQRYAQVSKKLKNRKFSVEHRKNISLSLMGDKNPAKRKDVRKKIRNTCVNNYLNLTPHNPFLKSCKRQWFSGTTLHYQGSYEFDFLQEFYGKINIENGLIFTYIDNEGNQKRYFSDFYLPDYNLIVEIKSTYTLLHSKGAKNNQFKETQVLNDGFNFIWIVNKDYTNFLSKLSNFNM